MDACCEAIQQEVKPGDVVIWPKDSGAGMKRPRPFAARIAHTKRHLAQIIAVACLHIGFVGHRTDRNNAHRYFSVCFVDTQRSWNGIFWLCRFPRNSATNF